MAEIIAGRNYVGGASDRPQSRVTQRVLIAMIIILSLVLVGELVFHLFVAPRLMIREVEVESDLPITDEQLLAAAGVRIGTSYFEVDTDAVEAAISAIPVVHSTQVTRQFPDRLQITVARRTPLVTAIATVDDRAVSLVADVEGVVFQIGATEHDLPIISGLRFQEVGLGMQLPQLIVGFLGEYRKLSLDSPSLARLCSEFRIVRINDFVYEVVLYTTHYRVPVRIGASIDKAMLQYIVMVLDLLEREGRLAGVREVDFRGGEAVLVMEEGSRG